MQERPTAILPSNRDEFYTINKFILRFGLDTLLFREFDLYKVDGSDRFVIDNPDQNRLVVMGISINRSEHYHPRPSSPGTISYGWRCCNCYSHIDISRLMPMHTRTSPDIYQLKTTQKDRFHISVELQNLRRHEEPTSEVICFDRLEVPYFTWIPSDRSRRDSEGTRQKIIIET